MDWLSIACALSRRKWIRVTFPAMPATKEMLTSERVCGDDPFNLNGEKKLHNLCNSLTNCSGEH